MSRTHATKPEKSQEFQSIKIAIYSPNNDTLYDEFTKALSTYYPLCFFKGAIEIEYIKLTPETNPKYIEAKLFKIFLIANITSRGVPEESSSEYCVVVEMGPAKKAQNLNIVMDNGTVVFDCDATTRCFQTLLAAHNAKYIPTRETINTLAEVERTLLALENGPYHSPKVSNEVQNYTKIIRDIITQFLLSKTDKERKSQRTAFKTAFRQLEKLINRPSGRLLLVNLLISLTIIGFVIQLVNTIKGNGFWFFHQRNTKPSELEVYVENIMKR